MENGGGDDGEKVQVVMLKVIGCGWSGMLDEVGGSANSFQLSVPKFMCLFLTVVKSHMFDCSCDGNCHGGRLFLQLKQTTQGVGDVPKTDHVMFLSRLKR